MKISSIFKSKKLKLGFTLAEVLIVVGIIGIVAEMTIPTLVNNIDESANIAGWKKTFSALSQAHSILISRNEMPYSSTDEYAAALASVMKVSKLCPYATINECWHNVTDMRTFSNVPLTFLNGMVNGAYGFILPDGTRMLLPGSSINPNSPNTPSLATFGMFMLVDANGLKSPNRFGYDIFVVEIYGNRLLPSGAVSANWTASSNCVINISDTFMTNGAGCGWYALMGKSYK